MDNTGTGVDFAGIKVARDGNFARAQFVGPVALTDSAFGGALYFNHVTWPTDRSTIYLGNMHYHDVFVDDQTDVTKSSNRWSDLRTLLNDAYYWPQNYTDAKTYYKSLGKIDDANAAFVDGKRKQRPVVSNILQVLPWSLDVLLDSGLCYGRCPARMLVPSLAFVLVGTIVFRRVDRMQFVKGDGPEPKYNPSWYSLDHFAPVISLSVRDLWTPQKDRRWATSYMHIQTLAGWILVPIALAALTGLLK